MSLDSFDDEMEWVPLHPSDHDSYPAGHDINTNQSLESKHFEIAPTVSSQDGKDHLQSKGNSSKTNRILSPPDTLEVIQKKHEMKQSLRKNLVQRPFADFPKVFLKSLVLEVWNCHYYVRLGVFLISLGLCAQVFSLLFLFYQSLQILPVILLSTSCALILSYLYLSPKISQMKLPENIMDGFWTFLESVDGHVLQRLVIALVYIVPMLMEIIALSVLSAMVAEGHGGWAKIGICWLSILVESIILLRLHFDIEHTAPSERHISGDEVVEKLVTKHWGNGRYIIGKMTLIKKTNTTLFHCRLHAWMYLYGMAFLMTTIQVKMHRIHQPILLSGPFLIATGAFLILSVSHAEGEEDFFLGILRKVLRRSLRDILWQLGDAVAEDEMLRLAMLRWIVDYWSSTTSWKKKQHGNVDWTEKDTGSTGESTHDSGCCVEDLQVATSRLPHRSPMSNRTNAILNSNMENDEIEWTRLYPMLNMTTDQMLKEVKTSSRDQDKSPIYENHEATENPSVTALKQMLASLNCDERAKPAIESYKKAISEISPSRSTAVYVGMAHRSPATISCLVLYILAPMKAIQCTIMLLPLMFLEMMRISEWIYACHQCRDQLKLNDTAIQDIEEQTEKTWLVSLFPLEVSSMEILLCKDDYHSHKCSTAMMVWWNVQNSVKALESGLTAIKCVRTAHVATDLAFNIVSLAKIVQEVKSESLVGGIGLIVLEVFHFHLHKASNNDKSFHQRSDIRAPTDRGGYVQAAFDLVENTQRLTKSVSELAENGNVQSSIHSFLNSAMNLLFRRTADSQAADSQISVETGVCQQKESPKHDPLDDTKISLKEGSAAHQDDNNTNALQSDLGYDTEPRNRIQSADEDEDVSWTTISRPKTSNAERVVKFDQKQTLSDDLVRRSIRKDERDVVVESKPKDNLKWIGAVAAVIGTVVGGIALTSNNRTERDSLRDNVTDSKRTTVVIEEIDDDES